MAKRVRAKRKVVFNPIEGEFDIISDNNFSYVSVPEGRKLEIPENMQMAVHGCEEIDGEMRIDGELIVEE